MIYIYFKKFAYPYYYFEIKIFLIYNKVKFNILKNF